jgi:hypothetical protein
LRFAKSDSADCNRTETIEDVRKLFDLAPPATEATSDTDPPQPLADPCPCCGGRMIIIETFEAGCQPHHRPTASRDSQDRYLVSVDTSNTTARFSALVIHRQRRCSLRSCSAFHLGSCASPKHSVSTAHSSPISRSSTHHHNILTP